MHDAVFVILVYLPTSYLTRTGCFVITLPSLFHISRDVVLRMYRTVVLVEFELIFKLTN